MGLFGTDGVRGLANRDLTAELALDLAVAAAHILGEAGAFVGHRPRAIVGHDSRASGEFLEAAVVAGLASAGVDVFRVGVLPTPAIAYLVAESGADLGVMISASHNPMPDNGIKFFAKGGEKLDDSLEAAIEARLGEPWERPIGREVGRIIDDESAPERYIYHLLSSIDHSLHGIHVVVDCANGASSEIAPEVLRRAGATVTPIFNHPNGWNINEDCGSTHLHHVISKVKEVGADIGIAHDGDADRCLAVNAAGEVIDGDAIMAILALDMKRRATLDHNTVVGTVMSNLGFINAMKSAGINVVTTSVGDRYVLERMNQDGFVLGGEQSGHIIVKKFSNTGDGILTALLLLQTLAQSGESFLTLSKVFEPYPQMLISVKDVAKNRLNESVKIRDEVARLTAELNGAGRILLRPSGTEPVVRVMVEAASKELTTKIAEELAVLVKAELGA